MKILVIADEESRSLWDFYSPEKVDGVDLIISCGDLKAAYLEFLATMVKCPVLYVPGNHDTQYKTSPPEGCHCIDGTVYNYKGVRIFGLGGSMKYKNAPYMYTEKEMRRRLWLAKRTLIRHSGIDIFVTHAPAKGYGDMSDKAHTGFECFNTLLGCCQPSLMLHGHVHATYSGRFSRELLHPSGTRIINGYEKYIFDFDETKKHTVSRKKIIQNLVGKFL